MRKILLSSLAWMILLGGLVQMTGCANNETADGRSTDENSPQRNTSAIPWNRPQSWEGSTGYGGMVNQPSR
ncbi:MAG: hypothetical protein ABI443_13625 [Chthoniobacterales bacterium]